MSALIVNTDGTLAIHGDGTLVTDEDSAPCCCGPGVCERVIRFVLCSEPRCWPPGYPTELFVCADATVQTPTGPVPLGDLIDAGQDVTARRPYLSVINPCYTPAGDAPRGTVTTPGVALDLGPRCSLPECEWDLCGQFWRVRPCGPDDGSCGEVFVRAGAVGVGGVFVVDCGGRQACYCLRPNGPTIREDQLPPGARIIQTPQAFFVDCCHCGQAIGQCQTRSFPSWIGRNPDGSDIFEQVECCCPSVIRGIAASGFIVNGFQNVDGSGDQRTEISISGAIECPAGSGSWYFAGLYRQIIEGVEVFRQTLGCPGPGLLAFPVNTQCGGYLRAAEEDFRSPGGGPPSSLQGVRTINGACQFRDESWATENLDQQASGSVTRAYSSGTFSVRIITGEGCTDDCSKLAGLANGQPSGQPGGDPEAPIDPAIRAAFELQIKRLGCSGCGG